MGIFSNFSVYLFHLFFFSCSNIFLSHRYKSDLGGFRVNTRALCIFFCLSLSFSELLPLWQSVSQTVATLSFSTFALYLLKSAGLLRSSTWIYLLYATFQGLLGQSFEADDFFPLPIFAVSGNVLGCYNQSDVTACSIKISDAADKYPAIHLTAPTNKSYLIQNVSRIQG